MLGSGKETLQKIPQNRSIWGEGKRDFDTTWSTRCHENVAGEGENRVAPDPLCWGDNGVFVMAGVGGASLCRDGAGMGFTSPALHPGRNCPDEAFGVKTARPGSAGSSCLLLLGTQLFHRETLCKLPGAARKRAGWGGTAIKGILLGAG